MSEPSDSKPDWWIENEQSKEHLGLPAYEPPRFEDGTYTHTVVEEFEDDHDCSIRFLGVDTRYPDPWEVRIDGTTAFEVERHRDDKGNTVFELSGEEFRERARNAIR